MMAFRSVFSPLRSAVSQSKLCAWCERGLPPANCRTETLPCLHVCFTEAERRDQLSDFRVAYVTAECAVRISVHFFIYKLVTDAVLVYLSHFEDFLIFKDMNQIQL